MRRFITILAMLTVATTMLMAQDGAKRYGIKSGTITMVSDVMGQKIESTSQFDDYGNLEVSSTNSFGMEITTILRDGKTYMVNRSAKQVQEIPQQESVNYLNLTDEIVKKYKIKEAGKDTVIGKECVKYTMEISQMGQTAKLTVSVWCGIPLKTVTSAGGMTITATAKSFVEEEVDASLFVIPTFN